jgi:glucosamine 6-phosphate synthetase-like amidotransferase/phosphosugar isomerase protein
MCRIMGFCGTSNTNVTALLRGLLLAEEKSNPHGTGIVIKKTNGKNLFQKKGIRAKTFLLQGYADFLWRKKYQYALGHVRFKTAGKQSDRNSHPFGVRVHDKWHFGIHNGIIGCTEELAIEFGIKQADVDSETFWHCMAKLQNEGESVVDAIERVTHFISDKGDFAFAYMTESEIFFWRNEQRPLCVFDARKHGMGRFIASTKEMFTKAWHWACPDLDIRKVSYFEAKPYRLYRMAIDTSPKYEVEACKELKYKTKEVRKETMGSYQPVFHDPYGYGSLFRHYGRQSRLFEDEEDKAEDETQIDLYGVRELSDVELETAIFNKEIELDNMDREDPVFDEWYGYLRALYKERARRIEDAGVQKSKR